MVRLSDDCVGHVYFFQGGEWILSANKIKLPAGWYAGPINLDDNNNTTP